jgi:alpha-galactosidase
MGGIFYRRTTERLRKNPYIQKVSAKSITYTKEFKDSDFVINQIEVNGLHTVKNEFEIPLKYGIKQCIGDTMGPGGLFKTLRTLPAWFEIIKDLEDLCPNTQILSYTNPMSAITLATTKVTKIPIIGLCHSVQETSEQLAEYLNLPLKDLKWNSAGINHMSWILELSHKGIDMYPTLMKKIEDPEFLAKDPVRFDAMKYLGAFVTESSGHFSEYKILLTSIVVRGIREELVFMLMNGQVGEKKPTIRY